ncbi:hypothetical protein [Sorangium sp. So ce176]|uniref:hypothetical protein n=1 Tax=Sorangium sp. So ce176 TaxID=3133286 RepID=UPI003F5F1B9F
MSLLLAATRHTSQPRRGMIRRIVLAERQETLAMIDSSSCPMSGLSGGESVTPRSSATSRVLISTTVRR